MPVTSLVFSPNGTRLATESRNKTHRVWDVRTGKELTGEPANVVIRPNQVSPDDTLFAHASGRRVELIPLTWDAGEIDRRLIHTQPNVSRYRDGLVAAEKAKDLFATRFYLDRLLSLPNERTPERFREWNDLVADPRLVARSAFHHSDLAGTDHDRPAVELVATVGDPLARRLVAQERLRAGTPGLAVPLLFDCLLTRPVNAPPVEELLLAGAYLDLNQSAEARRCYKAAANWLERPKDPMRAANVITHAINPIGEVFKPIDDPRHSPFDWESWHECDVFRAEVEKRLGGNR